ncbi:MAG: GH92 family glycosyl hydrolase [Bacteroidota bacterium]
MHKKSKLLFLVLICSIQIKAQDFSSMVDPMIGTGGAGHTYPGATVPFGMVQVSPDTRIDGSWEGCGGYHHSDSLLYGFSHTHLSGTGCPDYGDVLLLPFSGSSDAPLKKHARFSHANESASPGYYSVHLEDDDIDVQLTAGLRSGFHLYEFAAGKSVQVLLDLFHRDQLLDGSIRQVSTTSLEGYRRSEGWAKNQELYYCMEFDRPFTMLPATGDSTGKKRVVLVFEGSARTVRIKVGLSSVSEKNAWLNLRSDMPDWDFDKVRNSARASWNKELSKIKVNGATDVQSKIFYTALYHCMVVPNTFSDVNGEYRGRDGKIHKAVGYTHYSVFSLWDTFRAWHPLMTLIDRKRTSDYIKTFLAQYKEGGLLPVWELWSNETECMIGYHSIPVITDAWMNGIRDFDANLALEAMRKSAESRQRYGLGNYVDGGRLTMDDEHESVSKTLEYAYDDWCIAQFAKSIGNMKVYETYMRRSQSWKNLFDESTGFIRPVKNGGWLSPFDPYEVNNNFTEANAWQYTFFVPQDIPGLQAMLGGKDAFAEKLDDLFSADTKTTGREQADISGLIGQYAHGNEPSHNMAYLYDYADQPWKTQDKVRSIMDDFYKPAPDGLIGNEDCGQMSAWFVLSSLGFYPVTPGAGYFAIGTPLFPEVIVSLESGKNLTVRADEVSSKNRFITAMTVNGKVHDASFLSAEILRSGATIDFSMSDKSNKGRGLATYPHPTVDSNQCIIRVPMLIASGKTFNDTLLLTISSGSDSVFYTLDGTIPSISSKKYSGPVLLNQTSEVRAVAVRNGMKSSATSGKFHKLPHPDWKISISSEYTPQYSAGGPDGIINGVRGDKEWRKGDWQGYQGQDFEAVIDMGSEKEIKKFTAGFLQDTRAWIIMPQEAVFLVSTDGKDFKEIGRVSHSIDARDMESQVHDLVKEVPPIKVRYVKVRAVNFGDLPPWHLGAGYPAYIFIDEIMID